MLNARTRSLVALVPAIVTFVVIALALANFRALQRAVEWVDHTRQVIDRSDALLARTVDAETGQRGFLLTGDIIQVVADRKHVSFMYSYPNYVPLSAAAVERII